MIVLDRHNALIDQAIAIRVERFPRRQPVTITATQTFYDASRWQAHATFISDDGGSVDVAHQAPVSGKYDGGTAPDDRVAELTRMVRLKKSATRWIIRQDEAHQSFKWQQSFTVFSVSPADQDALIRYIETQDTFHRSRTFQQEMRAMYAKYDVGFDERRDIAFPPYTAMFVLTPE